MYRINYLSSEFPTDNPASIVQDRYNGVPLAIAPVPLPGFLLGKEKGRRIDGPGPNGEQCGPKQCAQHPAGRLPLV